MKKILNFVIIVWLLLSSILIAKGHLYLELPQGIDIQLNTSVDQYQDQSINIILDKCKKYDLDIYKSEYLGSQGNKELYKIYYTSTSSNHLLSSLTIMNGQYNGKMISTQYNKDKPYIKAFNIDIDYEFHDLKDSLDNTPIGGVYKILSSDESNTNQFINELKDNDFIVDVLGKGKSIPTNENTEIYIFFITITLLISFYIIIQNQKDISIKKLNGYSHRNIMRENNTYIIKKFVIYASLVSIVDMVILLSMKEYDSLFDYIFIFYLLQLISLLVLLVLNNISNLYLLKIHPVSGIKNFSKDIMVDITSMIVKIVTVTMIVLYLLTLSITLTDLSDMSSNVENWESTKNLAYTITQGYYPSTQEEEKLFEQKFKKLYTELNASKSAILLDASSFNSNIPRGNESWSYDSSKIIINRNYLLNRKISPSIISQVSHYDKSNTLLFIPKQHKSEAEKIKNNYFENLPLNHKDQSRLKTIIYEDDISLFTADLGVETKGNNVKNPIIIIDDNNFQDFYYLSVFSSGSIHIPIQNISAPYDEIEELIVESKLENTIKVTPLVYSRYSEKISEFNADIAKISLQLFLLFFVGSTLIYNSIFIFMTKNSKEIVIKKMIGYQRKDIYDKYFKDMLFVWVLTSICSYLYMRDLKFVPILLSFILFELLLTYIIIGIQERKNILSILKGNN